MKLCLNCQNEFEHKRDTAKYCSDRCRAAYNRAHPEQKITKLQMQSLYNSIMEAIDKISKEPMPDYFQGPKEATIVLKDPYPERKQLGYNDLASVISAATSATELHAAWKLVEKTEGLASWHLRELNKLKELQRTKIDF